MSNRRKISNKKLISLKELTGESGANGVITDFKDHTDPKYIGPGTWNVIHRIAFKARIHDKQIIFIELMKEICYGFTCIVCKDHCTEYIKNHPMEEYIDVLVDINGECIPIGMFVWTWKFHNAVNARLGKPIMSWDTVYNLYADNDNLVCSKNCSEANDSVHNSERNNFSNDNKSSNLIPKIPEFNITQPFRLISVNRK